MSVIEIEDGDGSLAALIRSYLDDPEVALTPGDAREHRRNTWGYGFEPADVDPIDVARALTDVADALRSRLGHATAPATFYAWVDEQAGQLRCSLASSPVDGLPFGAAYEPSSDPAPVVARLQSLEHPGHVLWEELSDTAPSELDDRDRTLPPFPVWTARIA